MNNITIYLGYIDTCPLSFNAENTQLVISAISESQNVSSIFAIDEKDKKKFIYIELGESYFSLEYDDLVILLKTLSEIL